MTQRIERVLDKLYNLKGENNFVIAEIEENIRKAEAAITTATEEQNSNEIKKTDIIGKLTVFNNQKDAFLSAFSDLDDDTFSSLRDINVEATFGSMVATVKEKAPEYCERLENEIKEYEDLIEKANETVTEKAALVAELEDNKRTEEDKREKLVNLIEQSLSTEEIEREALSTSYVKKIISAFGLFSDEEVTSLAKLIMFPEDGLIEYNDAYDETVAARFTVNTTSDEEEEVETSEPVESEKEIEVESEDEKEIEKEEPVEEEKEESEDDSNDQAEAEEIYQNVVSSEEVTDIIEKYQDGDTTEISLSSLNMSEDEPTSLFNEKEVEEEKEIEKEEHEEPKEDSDIDKIITSLGLDAERVNKELKELLSQADYKLIEENYEILRSAYVSEDAIYQVANGHSYLTDQDLNKKITLLRAKGVSEIKIKEFLEKETTSLRGPIDELTSTIDAIASADGKIGNENIYKIDLDNKRYELNKKALNDAGYDIEEKEERNYNSVIYTSPYLPDDIKVLKDYLISIIKRNSKYALSVFWKSPTELLNDIDDIIEAGLENILEINPEVLEENNSELIKRVKYCHESGHQVYVGEDKDLYCDYITNYARFQEKIGTIEDLPELETKKNSRIIEALGNIEKTSEMVKALDKYYENPSEYQISSEVDADANSIRQSILNSLDYEDAGKYTYKIKDILVSKNKIDRNVKVILTELEESKTSYKGLEREIVLAAILYNLRISEDAMTSLINECLNQGGNE